MRFVVTVAVYLGLARMQRFKRRITFTFLALVFWIVALPAYADYYDGLRAFDAGDFASAAAEWQAAGDALSLRHLGQLYEEGRGVPQSFAMAHAYYNLAAARGDDPARAQRDAITARMTRDEIMRAQRMVEEGVIKQRPNPVSVNSSGVVRKNSSSDGGIKKLTSKAALDGEWTWEMKIPSSPCDGMSMMPMWIQNGRVQAKFSHGAAGVFTLFGNVAADGSVVMFAAGDHLQFSFTGVFAPGSATGELSGTGETSCDGTWLATKQR